MSVARKDTSEEAPVATDGRAIGKRAMATRRKLLDATRDLLERDGLFDLKLVDITRQIDASPATFYQYFTDIDDALLCLTDDVEAAALELLTLLEGPWESAADYSKSQEFVRAYISYWESHGPVLRVRNLKAEEGEQAFRKKRSDAQLPILEAFADIVRPNVTAGRLPADADAIARAAAMMAMLERLTFYRDGLASRGTSQEALINTMARILFQTLTGFAGE